MTFPVVSLWIVLKPQVFFTCLFRGVDIIAAAFFGLIFLGETINYLHFIALFLSAVGALFISQPEFLFGSDGHENHLGSVLALLSGFFQAASFICARKSQHMSVAVLTFFSLFLAVFMSLLPPLLPMVHTATGWQWMILESTQCCKPGFSDPFWGWRNFFCTTHFWFFTADGLLLGENHLAFRFSKQPVTIPTNNTM